MHVPLPLSGCRALRALCLSCVPDDRRHQRGHAFTAVLLQLNREHFCCIHLGVEKLDDAPQLNRDRVSDEEQSKSPSLKICPDVLPIPFHINVGLQDSTQLCLWIDSCAAHLDSNRPRTVSTGQCRTASAA